MFRLESFAPISGRWFQSGPSATDAQILRREVDQARALSSPVAVRVVGEDGEVVAEYRPEVSR